MIEPLNYHCPKCHKVWRLRALPFHCACGAEITELDMYLLAQFATNPFSEWKSAGGSYVLNPEKNDSGICFAQRGMTCIPTFAHLDVVVSFVDAGDRLKVLCVFDAVERKLEFAAELPAGASPLQALLEPLKLNAPDGQRLIVHAV